MTTQGNKRIESLFDGAIIICVFIFSVAEWI